MASKNDWPCDGISVDEAAAQSEIAGYFLNLKFGLHALEPNGLRKIAEVQFAAPRAIDCHLALNVFEFNIVAATLQLNCALDRFGPNQIAAPNINAKVAAEVLHPNAGMVAINLHSALQVVDLEVAVASSGLDVDAFRKRDLEVRRDVPLLRSAVLVGADHDRVSLLDDFELSVAIHVVSRVPRHGSHGFAPGDDDVGGVGPGDATIPSKVFKDYTAVLANLSLFLFDRVVEGFAEHLDAVHANSGRRPANAGMEAHTGQFR